MSITRSEQAPTGSVWQISAFRVLFVAEVISVLGSQIARFALAALVYERTGSAAASALTYATTFLPAILGGLILGSLGDRFPQRRVMIALDVIRAVLFGLMALPGLPVAGILGLLVGAVFLDPAFGSAQTSYLATRLDPEMFRAATGWRATADQVTQVVGFGLGGVIVLAISPRGALVLDAATFLSSASMLAVLLRTDSPGQAGTGTGDGGTRSPRDGPEASRPMDGGEQLFAGLWRDRRTRLRMVFTLLVGLYVLPEALAIAYASDIGATTTQAGALLAMIPLGSAIGCALILRVPVKQRNAVTKWLAVTCGLPLVICAVEPNWIVSMASWFVCGLLTAYEVDVISELVLAMPAQNRARLSAISGVWLTGAQGVSFALAGAVAELLGAGATIAGAGGLGAVVALSVLVLLRRSRFGQAAATAEMSAPWVALG